MSEESEESKAGREFNNRSKDEQGRRNDALDEKNKAEESNKYNVTTPVEKWSDPSGKGGYKRRRRRSTKRRRRSTKKRRRTMRRY